MGRQSTSCGLAVALTLGLALGATSAGPTFAAAAIYRWVDASGTVHYSQSAPQGVPFELVTPGNRPQSAQASLSNPRSAAAPRVPAAAPASATSATAAVTPTLTDAQRELESQLEREAEARLAEVRSQKQQNCIQAREQFQQFTTYARIRVSDGAGGMKIIGEDERQERIEEAKQAIVLNCENSEG